DRIAVELREADVEQDQPWRLRGPQLERLLPVARHRDRVPGLFERVLQEALDVRLVVDDQDLGHALPPNYEPAPGPMALPTNPEMGPRSSVNSVGMTNLVDGLAPSALSASRYCSAIVFWSMSFAAPKIRLSAWLKPSARRIAAWRSP